VAGKLWRAKRSHKVGKKPYLVQLK
jgi:hypothetical protein